MTKKEITLEQFLNDYNYAPWGLDEVAFYAATVTDNPTLAQAAKAYLDSERELNTALEKAGFSFG